MPLKPLLVLKRALRSPLVIVSEISGILLASVMGAFWQQNHIFQSPAFAGCCILAAASLAVVLVEQFRRVRFSWNQVLTPSHFKNAYFKAAITRPKSFQDTPPRIEITTRNQGALLGSPVFHLGLLLLMIAGAVRALFSSEAAVDLVEGESLPPLAQSWPAQWTSSLAKPICLDVPLTVATVRPINYQNHELKGLSVGLGIETIGSSSQAELALNRDFHRAGVKLRLDSLYGPAPVIEFSAPGVSPHKQAVLMAPDGAGNFTGRCDFGNGSQCYLQGRQDPDNPRAFTLELRVLKQGALLSVLQADPGGLMQLPDGATVLLEAIPLWCRLRASHDPSQPIALAGLLLVMAGAIIVFTIVKVDTCLVVDEFHGEGRIFAALRAGRFAPMFSEEFADFVAAATQVDRNIKNPASLSAAVDREQPSKKLRHAAATAMALCLLAGLCGCQNASDDEARNLIERYNAAVSEAYRRADFKLLDGVVGENEGRKITGLIGVRSDMGLTLDSRLLALDIVKVDRMGGEMLIQTREQWRYRDMKIGSARQIGPVSLDSYEMLYRLTRTNRVWLVDEIKFVSEPKVGRKTSLWAGGAPAIEPSTKEASYP